MPVPTKPKEFADFPLSIYDRPSIAASNLMVGNVGGAFDALFKPDDMSPDEIKTIQNRFLSGIKRENILVKTAIDMATNPLVIIGLVMGMGPWGKVAGLRSMEALGKMGKKIIGPPNASIMRYMSSGTVFRNIKGFVDKMIDVSKRTADFYETSIKAKQLIFEGAGRALTKEERMLVFMYNKKFNTVDNELQTYWKAFIRTDKPLTPDLQRHMKPEVLKVARQLQELTTKLGKDVMLDKDGNVIRDLAAKGTIWDEDYGAPNVIRQNKFREYIYESAGDNATRRRYLQREHGLTSGASGHTKARNHFTLPTIEDMQLMKKYWDPEQWDAVMRLEEKTIGNVRRVLQETVDETRSYYAANKSVWGEDEVAEKLAPKLKKASEVIVHHLSTLGADEPAVLKRISKEVLNISMRNPEEGSVFIDLMARKLGAPARYIMDMDDVMNHYIRSMAPTYAWFTPTSANKTVGLGRELEDMIQGAGFTPEADMQRTIYGDSVRPLLRGFMHPNEFLRSLAHTSRVAKMREVLSTDWARKWIPNNGRQWMMDSLAKSTSMDVGNQLASMYYLSTLGMNIANATNNAFQPFITTVNMVGPNAMGKGMWRVMSGLKTVMKEGPTVGWGKAFSETFKEYTEHFGHENILAAMTRGDILREDIMQSPLKGAWEKFKGAIQLPFGATEKWDRLITFYAGHAKAVSEGAEAIEAGTLARNLVQMTQFTGGVVGQPIALQGMWQPLRQYLHFPMRYMEYMYNTLSMGPEPAKLSLGVMGRTLAGSAAAYTAAKNLGGVDIHRGLLFGALPIPEYDKAPFYPWPLVPPAVGMVGDIAQSVLKGDYKGLAGRVGSMVVPGGLAIRRAYRTLAPKYARYDQRTPEGRIPIFNDSGTLVGTRTPMELTLQSVGIKPMGPQQEQAMMKYLLRQRDKIREYRRRYVSSIVDNDLETSNKIQAEFQQEYPTLGELTFRKSDLGYEKQRRTMDRVQKTLRTLPMQYRGAFQDIVDQAVTNDLAHTINQKVATFQKSAYPQLSELPQRSPQSGPLKYEDILGLPDEGLF